MKLYGLVGARSRDFLTYSGRVIVHGYPFDSARAKAELEWLFPGTEIREVPQSIPADQTLPVSQHPDLAAVRWPLDRRDFVSGGPRGS